MQVGWGRMPRPVDAHRAYVACTQLCQRALRWGGPVCCGATHQGGSCCLGRRRGQVCQHLFHLSQLLNTDVICVWCRGREGGGGRRCQVKHGPGSQCLLSTPNLEICSSDS